MDEKQYLCRYNLVIMNSCYPLLYVSSEKKGPKSGRTWEIGLLIRKKGPKSGRTWRKTVIINLNGEDSNWNTYE
jgi:hypothetical protein